MDEAELKARVARGVALLDWVEPGWAGRVNMDVAEFRSAQNTIPDQLVGLQLTATEEEVMHGMIVPDTMDAETAAIMEAALHKLWRSAVRSRQPKRSLPTVDGWVIPI